MNIKELVSFYHTARYRSISKAAKYLSIGQPTVTIHIQTLEKELKVVLFSRVKRPISLTKQGKVLLELSKPTIKAVENLNIENVMKQLYSG